MIDKIKHKIKDIIKPEAHDECIQLLKPAERDLVISIKKDRLTYLHDVKLCSIIKNLKLIDELNIPGNIIEAGCALGGSAILTAKLKNTERVLRVYDVFDMIPPPSEEDTPDVHERYKTILKGDSKGLKGDKYYGYEEDLYQKVTNNFSNYDVNLAKSNVELIKGLLQDTLSVSEPIAMAHIDVDWFDPVMTCLERIYPYLSVGGIIILDDYFDWGGCRKATDQFLEKLDDECYELDNTCKTMILKKLVNS